MIEVNVQKQLRAAGGPMVLDVSLSIEEGECLAVYGPSGSGKTSFLRILAGLLEPDRGRIVVDDAPWYDSVTQAFTKPQHRRVGFVFQDYALFPHLSVRDNLSFATGPEGDDSITELLEMFELAGLADQHPGQLSGGQRQRVAVARAIAQRPRLLLMDEPFSALDHPLQRRLRDYLSVARRRLGLTVVLVTHDPTDLLVLADRVLALDAGRVTYLGSVSGYPGLAGASGRVRGEVLSVEGGVVLVSVGSEVLRFPAAGRVFLPGGVVWLVVAGGG